MMKHFIETPYLVPFDGEFHVQSADTRPPDAAPQRKECKKQLNKFVDQLDDLQRIMYAHDHHSILLVFQAMDAAGKDSTIRAVTRGINPAGCQVHSFKKPSAEELDHDFLWRTNKALPERGRIGIFNRSYYEEVLVVRVHPEYLKYQRLPNAIDHNSIWQERYDSISTMEQHLSNNGTVVIKFWLNVSKEEQKNRFMDRLNDPKKHWKFNEDDLKERNCWNDYMHAYQQMLQATSKPWAPWYAIPADDKPYMRMRVAEIILNTMKKLDMQYPRVSKTEKAEFEGYKKQLDSD